jgi:hypothetical protein
MTTVKANICFNLAFLLFHNTYGFQNVIPLKTKVQYNTIQYNTIQYNIINISLTYLLDLEVTIF